MKKSIEDAMKGIDYQVKMDEREKEILFLREYGGITKKLEKERKTIHEKELPDEERSL